METEQKISTITELIDNAIKLISGRELVSSSEMVDLLLDIRSHSDLQFPTENLLDVICAPTPVGQVVEYLRMQVMCSACNEPLDVDTHATMIKVAGWVEYKGGKMVGKIVNPSGVLGYAHKYCIDGSSNPSNEPTLF